MYNVEKAYNRMIVSCNEKRSRSTRLKNWSQFIRLRDQNKCLSCDDATYLAAHHIVRKSLIPQAQYLPGNGISLCNACHRHVHEGFNGKPNNSLPMDSQGGEKIERMTSLYGLLSKSSYGKDARYYALSPEVLSMFKILQGYNWETYFDGSDVEQACEIWRCCPKQVRDSLLEANGLHSSELAAFGKGVTLIFDD